MLSRLSTTFTFLSCLLVISLSFSFLATFAVGADDLPRRGWLRARANHKGKGPALLIQMPVNGRKITGPKAALSGCTEPGASVTINGKPVTVYSSGAFAGALPLRSGSNTFLFRSTRAGQTTQKTIRVTGLRTSRGRFVQVLPSTPLKIAASVLAEPDEVQELLAGDTLRVRFLGSPGGRAFFRIADSPTIYPMRATLFHNGESYIDGLYEGFYQVQPGDAFIKAPIYLILEEKIADGGKKKPKSTTVRAPGTLTTVWKNIIHRYVEIESDETSLWSDRGRTKRMTYLQKGTRLEVIGRRGDVLRVRLGESKTAWVTASLVRSLTSNSAAPSVKRGSGARLVGAALSRNPANGSSRLTFDIGYSSGAPKKKAVAPPPPPNSNLPLKLARSMKTEGGLVKTSSSPLLKGKDYPLPILVEAGDGGEGANVLTLTLWGALSQGLGSASFADRSATATLYTFLEAEVAKDPLIESIHCRRVDDLTLVFTIALAVPRFWGYSARFDKGALRLDIRKPPALGKDPGKPLAGLQVLMAPGHGGIDSGAVGPGGLLEADANLAISQRLAKRLREGGAGVEMIRDSDVYVSLGRRAEIIRASNANLFISIHCNSVDDMTDQLVPRGPLTFFSYGHQLDLAWHLYQAMPKVANAPIHISGVRQRNFRVIQRCPHMPGVLVENLFISHPEDEMRLADPAFLDTLSEALYKGVVAYAQSGPQSLQDANAKSEKTYQILTDKRRVPQKFPQ